MRIFNYRKQLVFFMDLLIMTAVAVVLFVLSPIGNGTGSKNLIPLVFNLAVWFICIILFQIIFHTYDSLWRYAEGKEYITLLLGFGLGTAVYLLMTRMLFRRQLAGLYMISVLGTALILMLLVRFGYRMLRGKRSLIHHRKKDGCRNTAIIGAGDAGVLLLREMLGRNDCCYHPVLLLDDDRQKHGMKILDIPVRGPISNLPAMVQSYEVSDLILAMPSCSAQRRAELLNLCSKTGCHVRILPDRVTAMSRPSSLISQMRNVEVEDLLGRAPIKLSGHGTQEMIRGKTVLVTGGGGSIGSELCRQIAGLNPEKLIILDNYENSTYSLQQELIRVHGTALNLTVEIANVQDNACIQKLFESYKPELVFHAAAHKHVPLMEASPVEAVKNNVFGTWNVVQAASRAGVKKFVLISTDKAVNPTSVMGATKCICEMILSSMRTISKTKFVAVRFGNVLGSNGSVIPLFQSQIALGGPVTITDKHIIRYFMTISEAVSLVLQAGAMAEHSEVFVLDMGQPVKILELAEKLILLSGYQPYKEIPIVEVGLRPGEKLYEELLVGKENQQRTSNALIFVETEQFVSQQSMLAILQDLQNAANLECKEGVLAALRRCVPNYRAPEEVNLHFKAEKNTEKLAAMNF